IEAVATEELRLPASECIPYLDDVATGEVCGAAGLRQTVTQSGVCVAHIGGGSGQGERGQRERDSDELGELHGFGWEFNDRDTS
ncbi:hypothetical protein GP486_004159, partial [Trichoglossum hirsutum]